MESIFVTNTNPFQPPIYKLQLSSNDCSYSYLSNSLSSGFCDESIGSLEIGISNESKHDLNGSFESLMDSDLYYSNDLFLNDQPSDLTVFESNQLINSSSNNTTQLWQFLLEILEDKKYSNLIRWTSMSLLHNNNNNSESEFIIYDTKELARLWAIRRNRLHSMNQKKFNRILRHYYNKKNILKKPAGKRNTYLFQINVQPYLMFIKIEQEKLNRQQQMQFF